MSNHYSMRRGAAVLLLLTLAVASLASNLPLPSPEASSSITARGLKGHLSFLASDELGGRYTLSQGNRIAARYLASQLEACGYRGAAADRTFFQKVPLAYRSLDLKKTHLTIQIGDQTQEFKYGDDFASERPSDIDVRAGMVFAGYGISSPKNKYDDYATLEAKGRVVVLASGVPDPLKGIRLDDDEYGEGAAAAHGAAAVIIFAPAQLLAIWPQLKAFLLNQDNPTLPPPPRSRSSEANLTPILAGPTMIKAIAAAMGKDQSYLTHGGKPLQSTVLSATAEIKLAAIVKEAPQAQNVVGILDGADPKLKDEYVVFSAHYDHLKTSDNGEVFNGADDDGSGTVSVLEIARAFSVGPRPKRSILIVFHTGEEMGLYGSEFNTDYEPVVPLSRLVADFNIDMVGRSRPSGDDDPRDKELADHDSLYVIGADKLSTELNKISEQTNSDTARLRFDYTYNNENHPQRFYYRSDHYNYAKHGIPIIFYFTGVHRDYHRPTDDIEKIDFEKMERIDRMIFATGWRVANLDHRLIVDKKPQSESGTR
jgi:peptidase M28-like protein